MANIHLVVMVFQLHDDRLMAVRTCVEPLNDAPDFVSQCRGEDKERFGWTLSFIGAEASPSLSKSIQQCYLSVSLSARLIHAF